MYGAYKLPHKTLRVDSTVVWIVLTLTLQSQGLQQMLVSATLLRKRRWTLRPRFVTVGHIVYRISCCKIMSSGVRDFPMIAKIIASHPPDKKAHFFFFFFFFKNKKRRRVFYVQLLVVAPVVVSIILLLYCRIFSFHAASPEAYYRDVHGHGIRFLIIGNIFTGNILIQ